MSSISAPDPCLLAILLVTQSRAGDTAQITFHYPPDPFSHDIGDTHLDGLENRDSSSDSNSESSDDDNPFELPAANAKTNGRSRAWGARQPPKGRTHHDGESMSNSDVEWMPPWYPLLGLGDENLVSLLAPGRTWHKQKFEMGINDMTFLGRPVYARENGSWKRQRRKAKEAGGKARDEVSESHTIEAEKDMYSSPSRSSKTEEKPKRFLTMFHLVFVLNAPPLEQMLRVKEMYEHVAKRLSKILKLEQARSDYVLQQSEIIQRLRTSLLISDSAVDNYYSQITKQSTLAGAISNTYRAISQSRIAAVTLSPKVSISMQIPPTTSTSYLPSLTEPLIKPGLWLTTANDITSANADLDAASPASALQLAKTSTLLLKESPSKILKELQDTNGPLFLALTNFLDKLQPTKSFFKLSAASKISYPDIELLARHLIYWRRAVAIPPLHHRDTFIVSPNADMGKLREATKSFETSFPMMPSLSKLLGLLSGTPTPYGMLIPSSDHKEEYYRVLAWLMRGGWVTQLRTFVYVRVDPSIKTTVRENEREAHAQAQLERLNLQDNADSSPTIGTTSPSKRPNISRPSSDGRHSTSSAANNKPSHDPNAASLILSTLRASGEESKWLAHIAETLLTHNYSDEALSYEQKQELKQYWVIFVKYFNGAEALEMLPMREGLKRKLVWDMLGRLGLNFDHGVLDEKGENGGILVSVRHW